VTLLKTTLLHKHTTNLRNERFMRGSPIRSWEQMLTALSWGEMLSLLAKSDLHIAIVTPPEHQLGVKKSGPEGIDIVPMTSNFLREANLFPVEQMSDNSTKYDPVFLSQWQHFIDRTVSQHIFATGTESPFIHQEEQPFVEAELKDIVNDAKKFGFEIENTQTLRSSLKRLWAIAFGE